MLTRLDLITRPRATRHVQTDRKDKASRPAASPGDAAGTTSR